MTEQAKELRLEGIVRSSRYRPGFHEKQFVGAIIECSDGREWVIDYDEQSPFHAFSDRRVVVSGESYKPAKEQHLIQENGKPKQHFRVSNMRLVEVNPDAELVEVRGRQKLSGRFERVTTDSGESMLSFVSEGGETFLVANDPAGANVGSNVEVVAYAVQPPPSIASGGHQHLWVICPHSAADLWEWRRRNP